MLFKYKIMGPLVLGLVLANCHRHQPPVEDPAVWKKIKVNITRLDSAGLAGPANGKVMVNYEFCIPAASRYWKQVQAIDTTARKWQGKGRIQCKDDQWLIIGHTHQPKYARVLYQLGALPWVAAIEEVYWE